MHAVIGHVNIHEEEIIRYNIIICIRILRSNVEHAVIGHVHIHEEETIG